MKKRELEKREVVFSEEDVEAMEAAFDEAWGFAGVAAVCAELAWEAARLAGACDERKPLDLSPAGWAVQQLEGGSAAEKPIRAEAARIVERLAAWNGDEAGAKDIARQCKDLAWRCVDAAWMPEAKYEAEQSARLADAAASLAKREAMDKKLDETKAAAEGAERAALKAETAAKENKREKAVAGDLVKAFRAFDEEWPKAQAEGWKCKREYIGEGGGFLDRMKAHGPDGKRGLLLGSMGANRFEKLHNEWAVKMGHPPADAYSAKRRQGRKRRRGR